MKWGKIIGAMLAIGITVTGIGYIATKTPRTVEVKGTDTQNEKSEQNKEGEAKKNQEASLESAVIPKSGSEKNSGNTTGDIENQKPLSDPPENVRAMYVTGWVAGMPKRMQSLMQLAKAKNINAFVVDIKDYSGYISYRSDIPEAVAAGAFNEIRIAQPNMLIKTLHDAGFYVIGRISTFQDPIAARFYPRWSVLDSKTGKAWQDDKGISWLDPASEDAQHYILDIAQDALARGFDEINFDYIRFPTDGALSRMTYSNWDQKTARRTILKNFFKHIRSEIPDATLSADVFGLVTVNKEGDMGIGQVLEDFLPYFNYVCPMIYPSHFASGFMGYKNPAAYPYEVIVNAFEGALIRAQTLAQSTTAKADNETQEMHKAIAAQTPSKKNIGRIRPWLQVFDLGAVYNYEMVQKQIAAVNDVLKKYPKTEDVGWLLWDPKNTYKPL